MKEIHASRLTQLQMQPSSLTVWQRCVSVSGQRHPHGLPPATGGGHRQNALRRAALCGSPTFQKFTTSLAALQTEVAAQEVQPSRLTVWQRWSAVGRQLVERDMKGQVIQLGMIAGVVFMRTLLQVGRCIQTRGQGSGGTGQRWRAARLQLEEAAMLKGQRWQEPTCCLGSTWPAPRCQHLSIIGHT